MMAPSFSAAHTAIFVGHCHRRWDYMVQQVLIQAYRRPSLLASWHVNSIVFHPDLSFARSGVRRSANVTSSVHRVRLRMAYRGMSLSKYSSSSNVLTFNSHILATGRHRKLLEDEFVQKPSKARPVFRRPPRRAIGLVWKSSDGVNEMEILTSGIIGVHSENS
jgi:hypothetical protein